jgi:hypothetical protein
MLWLVIEWLGLSLLLRLLIRKTAKNVKRTPIPVQTALARRISLSAIAVLPHKKPQMKTHLNDVKDLDHDRGFFIRSALAGLLFLPVAVIVNAQQITGAPGSPSATTTLSGEQLPPMPQNFGGKIERNADQSTPYWPARVEPPQGPPNILLIMTDDVGFGAPSTFGGVIPTPALDRIAANGLRYTNFHSTSLCSPTRAALITGRNHHSAGFGVVAEMATGYPGYDSIITRDKATIGRILKGDGYRTSWFGKDHNTPAFQASQDGPFDQWPIGMGFEYFYGFVGGDTSQW